MVEMVFLSVCLCVCESAGEKLYIYKVYERVSIDPAPAPVKLYTTRLYLYFANTPWLQTQILSLHSINNPSGNISRNIIEAVLIILQQLKPANLFKYLCSKKLICKILKII